jgi:hypothetical protein
MDLEGTSPEISAAPPAFVVAIITIIINISSSSSK